MARVALAPFDTPADGVEFAFPPHPIAIAETLSSSYEDASDEERVAVAPSNAAVPLPSPRIAPAGWDRRPVLATPFASHKRLSPPELAAPVGLAAGHHVLWMAALAKLPLPAGIAAMREVAPKPVPFYPAGLAADDAGRRWSADGWLLLRSGGAMALPTGAIPAIYGASQTGGVLRYRIAPDNVHRPEAYLRLATTLHGKADKEVAVGISAKPVPALPLRAAIELRASDQPIGEHLRPAAMIVTELPPIDLPHRARLEFYGQAGYIGGKFATSFADCQMRGDRQVADLGIGELRAGAGAWAGAQKGAARVDLGPTATIGVPIGQGVSARLGLDWRMRVAGNAQPGSGPALTLSAGF